MSTFQTYEEKVKAAELAIAGMDKHFGKGHVQRGNITADQDVDVIPTGNFGVDLAMGVGGLPKGRVAEIYGPEGSGKSLFCIRLLGKCQEQEGLCAYIDAEHALDGYWCKLQGMDIDTVHIVQPQSGEAALQTTEMMVSSGAYDLIVVDSVAALTPLAEINGEIGDSHVGLQARLMAQALRKINPKLLPTKTTLVFTNQLRDKIGHMSMGGTTTPGGRSLKFYASTRIEFKKIATLKKGEEVTGSRIRANILKNRVAPPFRVVEYDLLNGMGFNNEGIVIEYATKYGLVLKSGSWYYGVDDDGVKSDSALGQGIDNASKYLRDNPDELAKLQARVSAEYRSRQGYFLDSDTDGDADDD